MKDFNLGAWHNSYAFKNFTALRFTISFQGQLSVVWIRPMSDDTIIHSFPMIFNSNDGATRILFGKVKFDGRYISVADFKASYNLGTPSELGTGYIYVLEIKGFRY